MKSNRVWLVALILSLFFSIPGVPWGTDVLVFEGPVTCFDVDYTMDGAMFAVLQEDLSPDYPIHVYFSANSEHGRSWQETGRSLRPGHPVTKIRLLSGMRDGRQELYVFYVSSTGVPRVWIREAFTISEGIDLAITDEAMSWDQGTFAVARSYDDVPDLHDSSLPARDGFSIVYAYRADWRDEGTMYYLRSTDAARSWEVVHEHNVAYVLPSATDDFDIGWRYSPLSSTSTSQYTIVYPQDLRGLGLDCSLADPDCHSIFFGDAYSDGEPGCCVAGAPFWSFTDANLVAPRPGQAWEIEAFENWPSADSSPRVASATDLDGYHMRWVACAVVEETGNAALRVYKLDYECGRGTWSWADTHWVNPEGAASYLGDIEGYREPRNPYVNLTWVWDYGTHRDIAWAWSATDLCVWKDFEERINDVDAHSWPYGLSPKLVYSPGSDVGGAGIVFAGYGPANLYFDAPWTPGFQLMRTPGG